MCIYILVFLSNAQNMTGHIFFKNTDVHMNMSLTLPILIFAYLKIWFWQVILKFNALTYMYNWTLNNLWVLTLLSFQPLVKNITEAHVSQNQ